MIYFGPIDLRIKKLHQDAVVPKYMTQGSAGMDLTAVGVSEENIIADHGSSTTYVYDTGLAFEIPEGYVGLLYPRSSIYKTNLMLANHVGVVDSDFRASVKVIFRKVPRSAGHPYCVGDRVCQLIIMPFPKMRPIEVEELSETKRGTSGFGSTGT